MISQGGEDVKSGDPPTPVLTDIIMSNDFDLWAHYQGQPTAENPTVNTRPRDGGHKLAVWFTAILILTVAATVLLAHRSKTETSSATTIPTVDCTTLLVQRDMSIGMQGDDVVCLQQRLGDAGFPVPATGEFDEATQDAVEAFQAANGRTIDGVVGPRTGAALGLTFAP